MSFLFLLFLFTRETLSKVNSQTHNKTPMQDYSNSDYTGKISTIHINEDYSSNDITNSKFTDCALPSGENYLFSVQKDINFDNVEFSFSNTKVGAIKINHPGQISVRNCVFRKCSVNNGLGNALYISTKNGRKNTKEEEEIIIEVNIENNYYDSCGNTGYVNLVESKLALMRNNTFDFSNSANSCGAFRITCCGNITIIDCHFIKTTAQGTISYEPDSVANENDFIIIQDCSFKLCIGVCCFFDVKSKSEEKISIHSCTFESCEKGGDNSIAFSTSQKADSIILSISNNNFIDCGKDENNFYIINLAIDPSITDEYLTFENNVFETSCGAIKIDQGNANVLINNCQFKSLTSRPISLASLKLFLIEDCNFEDCKGAIGEIVNTISDASIERCNFSNCYYSDPKASVITISNQQCTFINNNVNFTSNDAGKSISGLTITSHGNIFVAYNNFVNIRKGTYSGIHIEEPKNSIIDQSDKCVVFNFNTIVNAGNVKLGVFSISKKNIFNFDHNIIKECKIYKSYATSIDLIEGNVFNNVYTLTNLSLINCLANCQTGGGLGLWITLGSDKTGTFKLKDCIFQNNIIDNKAKQNNVIEDPGSGCGGAFESGNATTEKMVFIADNCTFIENQAPNCGGALSIQSTLEAQIINCKFVQNQAGQGGGAIYIFPKSFSNSIDRLPSCIITGCSFEFNKDTSNNGHAIYFKYDSNSNTTLDIKNCIFTDNGLTDSNKGQGFTISSNAPYLNFENVTISFTESFTATKGVRVEENTKQFNAASCSFRFEPVAIQFSVDSRSLIDSINLIGCSSTNTLFSCSLSSNLQNLDICSMKFQDCTSNSGYLIDTQNAKVNISNSEFTSCGGNLISITNDFIVDTCTFTSNRLKSNGCLYVNSNSQVTIKSSKFDNQKDDQSECKVGGIYVVSDESNLPEVSVIGCTFSNSINYELANAILVEGDSAKITIKETQFSASITPNVHAVVLGNSNLNISDVTFNCIKPISFTNSNDIHDIDFINVKSNQSPLLTLPSGTQFSFDNIKFDNCISKNFIIQVETGAFQISNSIFEFKEANEQNACGCIDLRAYGSHKILSTYFKKNIRRAIKCEIAISSSLNHEMTISDCTFDGCSGKNDFRAFALNMPLSLIFTNNTIQNMQSASLSAEIQFYGVEEFTIESCNFINNNMQHYDKKDDNLSGGCGLMFYRKESTKYARELLKLNYVNCKWINNSVNKGTGGGALQVGSTTKDTGANYRIITNIELTFSKCQFTGNKALVGNGGALAIKTIQPVIISECEFINNEAETCGGAIYIEPELNGNDAMKNCDIFGCTFEGNHAKTGNGTAIYTGSALKTCLSIYSNNTFTNNNIENGGSVIYYKGHDLYLEFPQFTESQSRFIEFGENSEVDLRDVEFKGCSEKDGDGNAIKIDSSAKNIALTGCTFTNCGNKGYVIKDLGASVIFNDCSFIFENENSRCCALDITTNQTVQVIGCTFTRNYNANNDESSKSGTLYYHPVSPTAEATFRSCSFIECEGKLYKAFYISSTIEPEFSYITINNTGTESNPTGYIGEIYLPGVSSFTPSFCSINNNVASSEYGGGSAILIRSTEVNNEIFELTFQSCEWTNNYAVYNYIYTDEKNNRTNGVGGAYQRGCDTELSKVVLTFNNCTFLDNKSDREGGALAIQTVYKVTIEKCLFKGNRAGIKATSSQSLLDDSDQNIGYGGALYIDPDFDTNDEGQKIPSVDIENSKFIENEAVDGHAIYIRGGIRTALNLYEGNVFTDNGKSGSTIITECYDFNLDPGTVFNFTNSSESSHPYEFGPGATAEYDSTLFEDVSASKDETKGNAIHIREGVKMPRINNCTFRNCGQSGFVITIYCNSTEKLTFTNNTIIFDDKDRACKGLGVFTSSQMEIKDCYFERCNNYDLNTTGGGIHIKPSDLANNRFNDLEIINVTFYEMFGKSRRCFGITWWDTFIKMKQINILNCTESGYTGAIFIIGDTFTFELNEWTFINNTANSEFGGGSGLWIAQSDRKPDKTFIVTFKGCMWDGNYAKNTVHKGSGSEGRKDAYNGLGGAFQIGFSNSTFNCKITFENCEFSNNKADCEGGALTIQTTQDCSIKNCSFINNIANADLNSKDALEKGGGGAIFIDPDFNSGTDNQRRNPTTSIENCLFIKNTAGRDGHALSLTGDDAIIKIQNNTFTENGDNSNSVIYSICPYMTITGNDFTGGVGARAIELAVFADIRIESNIFRDFRSDENGGAILLSPPITSKSKNIMAISKQEYEIIDCQFINCKSQKNGGSVYISKGVESVMIKDTTFNGGEVTNGEGVAIYIDAINSFSIDSSVKFINQKCHRKYLISSKCSQFTVENIEIENIQKGSGIKGILLESGVVEIHNVLFKQCTSGIEVKKDVTKATIRDCIFSDCYFDNGNKYKGQVVFISNTDCTFTDNIINFTDNSKAITGLLINTHGNFDISYNKFIKIRRSDDMNSAIEISEKKNAATDGAGILRFNYNLIEDVGDKGFGIFNINKKYSLNLDHNIINGCRITTNENNGYACTLNLDGSTEFGNKFTFTNLTLSNCECGPQTGGGFGIWLVFTGNNGKLTFKDCKFENNRATDVISGGYGGAFASGNASVASMVLEFNECTFTGNSAVYCGGALALQSTQPALITNCIFTNNQANNGGGAIYIYPKETKSKIMPSCTISQCTFIGNKDTSNNGHAIFFKEQITATTEFTIEENCIFRNNGDLNNRNYQGYAIVSMAPLFIFRDSRFEYNDIGHSTSSLKLEGSSKSILTNVYFYQSNSEQQQGYDAMALFIDATSKSAEIYSCTFEKCGRWGARSAIIDEGQNTTIDNCKFLNEREGNVKTGAVYIRSQGIHVIQNCFAQYNWGDLGTFQYKPNVIASNERSFTFRNVTIDCVRGNDRIALNMEICKSDKLNVENITIQNVNDQKNKCLVGLKLANDVDNFTFKDFRFINNYVRDNNMGGSGIWFEYGKPGQIIKFSDCLFDANQYYAISTDSLSGCGGAFSIRNKEFNDIKVQMTNCQFINNYAERFGGALAFRVPEPISILDCTFKGNRAGEKAGAIYIDCTNDVSENIIISGCTFDGNDAAETSSLFLEGTDRTLIDISNCTFINNVNGKNIIDSKSENLEVHDMSFEFENMNANARPLYLRSTSKSEVYNVMFIKCSHGPEGTAIYTETDAQINAHDCIFEDCGNSKSSVYCQGSPAIFNKNIFRCKLDPKSSGLHITGAIGHIEVTDCLFTHLRRHDSAISPLNFQSKGNADEDFTFRDLIFSDCYGSNLRCFSISAHKPFTFENVTVRDNKLGAYLGQINLQGSANLNDEFVFSECKWINNACEYEDPSKSKFGGGAGLWLVNGQQVPTCFAFDHCLFENNTHTKIGGAFQDGDSGSVRNKKLRLSYCNFIKNEAGERGGALAIQTILPYTVDHCTFTDNKAPKGGAIYIQTGNSNIDFCSIADCTFTNNIATSEKGNVLCIEGCSQVHLTITGSNKVTNKGERGSTIYSECGNLEVLNLLFDFNSQTLQRNFRAAHLGPNSGTTFNGCRFTGTGFTTNPTSGHAVLAEDGANSLIFENCLLTNCGNHNSQYVIDSNASELQFVSSSVSFTDTKSSCAAIVIHKWCKLTLSDSTFRKCYANGVRAGAGICYNYDRKGIKTECSVTVEGCTFDDLHAPNGRAAFFKLGHATMFSNCTFKNMIDGNYILVIGHEENPQGQAILNEVIFMDNTASCTDNGGGGGAGLWLSQVDKYELNKCKFIRNFNNKENSHGGALGYCPGKTSNKDVELRFIECFFQDNRVRSDCYGGGLCINASSKPVTIEKCTFSNTIKEPSKYGGAIYVALQTTQQINIVKCHFENMNAASKDGFSGNAIYLEKVRSKVYIQDCTFLNCGSGGSVLSSNGQNVYFERNTITFSKATSDTSCKGIHIRIVSHFEIIDSTISNCFSNSNGAAFYYRDIKELQPNEKDCTENLVFENTVIDNCESIISRPSVTTRTMLLTLTTDQSRFYNLTLQNMKAKPKGGYILTIGHTPPTPGIVEFTQCTFTNCDTNIEDGDGGGIGLWCSDESEIKFDTCTFSRLTAATNGGAVSFTTNAARQNTKLTFDRCLFDQNTATKGTALYITTKALLHITECNFTNNNNNHQQESGGAIYISETCQDVTIEKTEFYSNTQTSPDSHGNAIYIQKQTTILGTKTISECKFFDNGATGSVIYSDGVDVQFLGNKVSFTQSGIGAKGFYTPDPCNIYIANSTFKGCVSTKTNEGGGFVFNTNKTPGQGKITLENTIFENNDATNGCAFYGWVHEKPTITDVTIRGHKSGNFIFSLFFTQKLDEAVLERCIFEDNFFNKSDTDGGGAGIWVAEAKDSTTPVTFLDCTFRNNRAKTQGGAMSYGESNTVKLIPLTYQSCIFTDNVAGKNGGALSIKSQALVIIDDCEFTSNTVTDQQNGKGNAIYLRQNTKTIISETTILNNGNKGSSIVFEGKTINIFDSSIEFDFVNESCRGIEIRNKGTIEFEGVEFLRCNARSAERGEGGGIFYHEAIPNNEELIFSLDSCIFDANDALNGSALLLNISSSPEIYGCTFKNHQSGSFIFSIVFSMFQMVYEFTDCTFDNNYHETSQDHEDGGGCGIWIANNKEIAAGRLMQIYFTSIKFSNNRSPCVGGAFAYGRSPTVYPSELYFDSCTFEGNSAQTDGGALWIITKSPYEIQYCNFKNNYAANRGGSIMVDTAAPIATIQTSSFEMESAATDGNSIYVTDKTPRFILSGNKFTDCGIQNNVITVDTTIAGFEGNTIEFQDEVDTCRGINLKSAGTFELDGNTFILCRSNDKRGDGYGGGLKFENVNNKEGVENLIISGNRFDSCIATTSGCAMYLRVNVPPTFIENDVDNCRYGTMIIHVEFIKEIKEYILDGFVFQNNEFNNGVGSEDAGGSGFWVQNLNNRPFNYTFRSVTWKENTATYAGGAFGFGRNSNYKENNLKFEGCTFINNRCKEQYGGALWLATTGNIEIKDCVFENNKALGTSSYGGAIYFDSSCTAQISISKTNLTKNQAIDGNALYLPNSLSEISIDQCNFTNNGNLNSTIHSICPLLTIENSFIGFDKYSLKCRGIRILAACTFTIRNTNITNCDGQEAAGDSTNQFNTDAHGGGIYYQVRDTTRSVKAAEENIIIEGVTFTNCKGSNGAACMLHPTTSNFIFNNNTIQDCRCGKFIFVIITQTFVEHFNIEDCTFKHNLMNNPVDSEDGGGSGIWIANDKVKIPQGSYTHLKFTRCKWLENQASTCGGAFAYGKSDTIKNTAITFDECRFLDNVAKNKEGGALWICTSVPFLIEKCFFQRNKAKGDSPIGGAIAVAATAPQINIKGTTFDSNEARDGNAIYVKYTTNDMNITDCTFQDNGIYGAVIANEAKSICIDTCYIQFDSTVKACRGIHFVSRTTALVRDSHFRNCKTTDSNGGGGIYYKNTYGNNDEESLTIEGCFFNNTQAPNGCALLTWLETPIILRSNLITHNTFGKFIVSVFYNKYVNETIIEDCYFEFNFFQNDDTNRDGGGSGLWIANSRGLVPDDEVKQLTFVGCTWRGNTADAYGGALSYGRSPTLVGMELVFRDCNFINNTATKTYGGALYIITKKPFTVTDCFFDGNKAGGIGGAIYFSKYGDVSITDTKFARNQAYEAGAVCCDGRNKVKLDSLVFSENKADIDAPNLLIRHYGDSPFNVNNCKFNFEKVVGQSQVVVKNNNYEKSEETVNFVGCCFTKEGDIIDETAFHIKTSLVSGTIKLGSGNCFDLSEELSFSYNNETTEVEIAEGIFDCNTCVVPTIPTSPPTNMPTQSPSPTPEATPRATDKLPDPTPRPTVDEQTTSAPPRTPARTVTPIATNIPTIPQSGSQTAGTETATIDTGNVVSKGKSNAKKIGMIVGICVAAVVIIAVVIILLWLFVFRRRKNMAGINDEGFKPNTLDNEASQEVDSTNAAMDDPIWSYQSQENPLYNDEEHNDANEDENAFGDDNNNFEESWGNTI